MKRILLMGALLALSSFVWDDTSSQTIVLEKKTYKKGAPITGKAFFYSKEIAGMKHTPMGYGAFDQEYAWIPNAVSVRPVFRNNKQGEYVQVSEAIQERNDTAYISFKMPEHLLKYNKFELKVQRAWHVSGKDTIFVKISRFKISK